MSQVAPKDEKSLGYNRYSDALAEKNLLADANGKASGSVMVKGQSRIVAIWTPLYSPPPPSPQPTPPATVTLRITPMVMASFGFASTSEGSHYGDPVLTTTMTDSSVQLENGFGDPPVLSPYSNPYSKEWSSTGSHVKTFSTAGITKDPATGKWVVELPVGSMSAAVSAGATGFYPSHSQYDTAGNIKANLISVDVQPVSASLVGHSTADTANWDANNPRFFSGTNCSAQAVASAVSGYVAHAQLLINGTIVREYWNSSTAPPAYSLAGYVSTGTNQASVSLGAAFDSTHFGDGSAVKIKMLVEDTAGNKYDGQISGNAYNKAEALVNNNPEWAVSSGLPGVVSGAMTSYTCPTSASLQKNDILAVLPSLSAFYISSHGNAGVIGDCDALSEIKYIDPVTHQPASYVNSFTYMYAAGDPTQAQGGVDISTKIGQKSLAQPPMNFVFLDGCLTASDQSSASAFGAAGTDRAFLGWLNSYYINEAHRDWTTRLMQGLSGGSTLRDAMIDATASGPADGDVMPGFPTPTPSPTFTRPADGPPAVPYYYGDGAMTLHGVYGTPTAGSVTPSYGWFKPQ